MSSVIRFAELPAVLVRRLGCHVGINFRRVGFELGPIDRNEATLSQNQS